MEEPEDFNLDDTFLADDDEGGDLGNIFEGDDDGDLDDVSTSKLATDIQTFKEYDDSENFNSNSTNSEKYKKEKEEEDDAQNWKKKRRRSSLSVDRSRTGPPPAWHNQAADKPHRETMIREMYVLRMASFGCARCCFCLV
jgi:hypothetical protein